jgi:cytochrome c oxidase subunit 2
VRIVLATQDVVHSLYVPAFRLKQDAVPGRSTVLAFTPTEPGEYRLLCTEYCGTSHARMTGRVVVMEPERYRRWLEARPSVGSLAEQGAREFQALGCSGCHAEGSSVRAPALEGIHRRSTLLTDGSRVVADEAFLRDSILLPRKHVVAGYRPLMPSYRGRISQAELLRVVAYLESLSGGSRERGR